MATHLDRPDLTGRHASLFVFDDFLEFEAPRTDLRASQAAFDAETAADRALRDRLRRVERIHSRVMVAAGVLLLLYMALGIIAAAFGGRL